MVALSTADPGSDRFKRASGDVALHKFLLTWKRLKLHWQIGRALAGLRRQEPERVGERRLPIRWEPDWV